jgi:hypothetical protein
LVENLAQHFSLDPKVVKDWVFKTMVLKTCSSLVEQNWSFCPWVSVRKLVLQCQIDAITFIPGADALELWLVVIGAYDVNQQQQLFHCIVFIKEEALL